MSASSRLRLDGLEADNLLAVLALLGLLRTLDRAEPGWRARAFWEEDRAPLRAVLVLDQPQTPETVAEAAAQGAAELAKAMTFDRADLTYSREEARTLFAEESDRARVQLFEALMSDGAARDDGRVWPTPLCFLFGQGHQHFLERLNAVPNGTLPKKLQKRKKPPDLNDPSYLIRTLFEPWTREDPTDGFRWDPAEDRRYALRAEDPSGDPAGAQHGANRLAALALPLLSGCAMERRRETRFLAVMTAYGPDGQIRFTWPLWSTPARLASILSLFAHSALAAEAPDMQRLQSLGVFRVMRAERISSGKFFNTTWAEQAATDI